MPRANEEPSHHAARRAAVHVVQRLREAGHTAYLAGGCVRDELLGNAPQDYDVATDATPETVSSLFRRTRAVGRAFGVIHVPIEGITTEVATFRTESSYTDRRRPDEVTFATASEDAERRDFTINALFIDPLDESEREGGRVIDYVNGLADLEAGVIRAVGDPDERLAEDDLRSLRAVRFAARLGFAIEAETRRAITSHAGELIGVSRERIGDELRAMLAHSARAQAVRLMHELTLDAAVLLLPHFENFETRVLDATSWGTDISGGAVGGLAAWIADRTIALRGGSTEGLPEHLWRSASETVRTLRKALVLSNDESDRLRDILEGVRVVTDDWEALRLSGRKRAASADWFAGAGDLAATLWPDRIEAVRAEVDELARTPGGLAPEPLVTGDDLVEAGFSPGPGFKGWLEEAYNLQLEGELTTREDAITRIHEWASREPNKE